MISTSEQRQGWRGGGVGGGGLGVGVGGVGGWRVGEGVGGVGWAEWAALPLPPDQGLKGDPKSGSPPRIFTPSMQDLQLSPCFLLGEGTAPC